MVKEILLRPSRPRRSYSPSRQAGWGLNFGFFEILLAHHLVHSRRAGTRGGRGQNSATSKLCFALGVPRDVAMAKNHQCRSLISLSCDSPSPEIHEARSALSLPL